MSERDLPPHPTRQLPTRRPAPSDRLSQRIVTLMRLHPHIDKAYEELNLFRMKPDEKALVLSEIEDQLKMHKDTSTPVK